jgi:hypothetical protein
MNICGDILNCGGTIVVKKQDLKQKNAKKKTQVYKN